MTSETDAVRLGLVSALIMCACGLSAAGDGTRLANLEAGEDRPGGAATTNRATDTRNAFSQASAGIGFEGESRFKVGNAIFRKIWVSAPASTKSSDGLGPIYNARACQHCHLKDGRGHTPAGNWPDDGAVSMFLRLSIPPQTDEHKRLLAEHRANVIPEPTYGGQLQDLGIQDHAGEGRMHIEYADAPVELGDGTVVTLRRPTYRVTNLGYGPMHPQTMFSPRVAPQMIGLGLLEAIPEGAIRANTDPQDNNGDGVSGRASEVWSHEKQQVALGRFGWKAGNPSVRQQGSDAFAGDMGLSTRMFAQPAGDCTQAQEKCRAAPTGEQNGKPEVTKQMLDLVIFYSQNLAVPKRRNPASPQVLRGKQIFNSIGCVACHIPTFKTGPINGQPHLSNQRVWPYTDLLLHDMGEGLADNRPEGVANGREWRTPPLWGIGLTQTVNGHTFFLHDGRARGIEEAILWHGGEAAAVRDSYAALSKNERDALVAFVNSL